MSLLFCAEVGCHESLGRSHQHQVQELWDSLGKEGSFLLEQNPYCAPRRGRPTGLSLPLPVEVLESAGGLAAGEDRRHSCPREGATCAASAWALPALKSSCHQHLLEQLPICHRCYKWFIVGDRELAIFSTERCPAASS